MIRVSELKTNAILPLEFTETLPTYCATCGYELEISKTLTVLKCVNPLCLDKVVDRLISLLQKLNIKVISATECSLFLTHFKVRSPYAILLYDPYIDGVLYEGCTMDISLSVYEEINKVRSMSLIEYVKLSGISVIQEKADVLLKGYKDMESFYRDLYLKKLDFIEERLNIKANELSLESIKVLEALLKHEDELRNSIEGVIIRDKI